MNVNFSSYWHLVSDFESCVASMMRGWSVVTCLQLVSWENISWSCRAAPVTEGGWLVPGTRVDQLSWWLHIVCLLPGKSWALQGQIQRQPAHNWWWGILWESVTACGGIEISICCYKLCELKVYNLYVWTVCLDIYGLIPIVT